MSRMHIIMRPSPIMGTLIALLGLGVGWLVYNFLPGGDTAMISGALTGGFGVLAVSRVWPGLPITRIHWWLSAVVGYGVLMGLVRLI